jgi:YidC/Oxa1 family membrane protein insertase
MNQDNRIIIAFALSFALLMLWRWKFVKEPPPQPKPAAVAQSQGAAPAQNAAQIPSAAAPQAAATSTKSTSAGKGAATAKPPTPVAIPVEQGTEAQEIVVESDLYRVTFSTEGAVVKSWVLKKYEDEQGKPLNVVNSPACEKLGYPMSVLLLNAGDTTAPDQFNKALYVAKPGETTLQAPAKVEFVYSDGKVRVRKEFTFGTGYEVETEISAWDGSRYLPLDVRWPGGFGDQTLEFRHREAYGQAFYSSAGKIETVADRKVDEPRTLSGPFAFVGLEDRYFASVFLPMMPGEEFPANAVFRLTAHNWTPPDWKEKEPPKYVQAGITNPTAQPFKFRLFVAPKNLDLLRAEYTPLEGLVDFGWFTIFAKPLFLAMQYIHKNWVHNYGWAIIILTLLINMAMFPLKLKQIRSAREMQKIAPLMKSIQDRYKQYKMNDPRKQRMNQEMMKLYKEHNVNPLGGCLPMAVQLPFLYGFYRVLDLPIELRHAPWIGWVKDLSAPETVHLFGYGVHILPIIMVVTTFLVQKMTPMPTTDTTQQRMMMMMPIIFGFMFYNLASGLVLYFLVANLVGIIQQVFINKTVSPPVLTPAAAKAPEAVE